MDGRGNLVVSEFQISQEFSVQRIYYITNVPQGIPRGAHGHKDLQQIFYSLKGQFQLSVSDGLKHDTVYIQESSTAYYVPNGLWRELDDFTEDCVCLVLASLPYDKSDYIDSYEEFKDWRSRQ